MFGWFTRSDRARLMAAVEKLEKLSAPSPFDAFPQHKANPQAYYNPATGTWAIGDIRFLAPDQERACNAVETVYGQVAQVLDDQAKINDLTFDIIHALIDKGAL